MQGDEDRQRGRGDLSPISAWRSWVIDDPRREPRIWLRSPAFGERWSRDEALEATCHGEWMCVPSPGSQPCRCGIYGSASLRLALAGITDYHRLGHTFFVVGRVALWGKVIPGESGWRAQFAYPTSLVFIRKSWLEVEAMERVDRGLAAYNVPVEMLRWRQLTDLALSSPG